MRGESLTGSATLQPNSLIILALTQHWVNTIAIYGAAEGPRVNVGGSRKAIFQILCPTYCVCYFLTQCQFRITTGRTPTFSFALCQDVSATGPDMSVRSNMAVNDTTPRNSCLLSAGLPAHPQNCFLVILHFPSPSSPTSSDGDPAHTVSTLQHFNTTVTCCVY